MQLYDEAFCFFEGLCENMDQNPTRDKVQVEIKGRISTLKSTEGHLMVPKQSSNFPP